jgi:hypothetical protein
MSRHAQVVCTADASITVRAYGFRFKAKVRTTSTSMPRRSKGCDDVPNASDLKKLLHAPASGY